MTFQLMFVNIKFVLCGLLNGNLLKKSCSLGSPYVHFVVWLFVILVISVMVLRG